jgi:hypothetical protein
MLSSTTPDARRLHIPSSFAGDTGLHLRRTGSAHFSLLDFGAIGSPLLRPAELLASLIEGVYFRAFDESVTLPAAGYDYGGNWVISTGGTCTRWTVS